MVKSLPAMQETQVQSLGQDRSPGERNGNPLQYSCLENSMDKGGGWAIVHGVARSRTLLSNCHSQGSIQTGLFWFSESFFTSGETYENY